MKESKVKRAVGIKYTPGDGLPQVILKGSGKIADEIINLRNKVNNPHIIKDEKLAAELFKLPIDAEITVDLYESVAIILAHVFSVNQKLREQDNG